MNNKANGKTGLGPTSSLPSSFPFFISSKATLVQIGQETGDPPNVVPLAIPGWLMLLLRDYPFNTGFLVLLLPLSLVDCSAKAASSLSAPRTPPPFCCLVFSPVARMINSKRHGFGISSSRSAMDSWFFRLIFTARIFCHLVHGSVRFTDRNHSLMNRRRFSDHCRPIQAHPWPWQKGGKKPLPPFGESSQYLRPAWSSLRTCSMAQPTAGAFILLQRTLKTLPNAALTLVFSSLLESCSRSARWEVLSDSFRVRSTFSTIPQVDARYWLGNDSLVELHGFSFACSRFSLIGKSAAAWRVNASTVIRKLFHRRGKRRLRPSVRYACRRFTYKILPQRSI